MKNQSAYILLALCSFFMLFTQNESKHLMFRITRGSIVKKGEFPFQVSFQKKSNDNKHFCGGSIVNVNFILTAAHCVSGQNLSDIRVVAGITNLKKDICSKITRNIADVFLNPQYHKPLPKDNDIALVKVDTPFAFNSYNINRVALVSPTYQITTGQKVHVTGWGLEKATNKSPSDKLKRAKLKVIKHTECVQKYKGKLVVENTVFCTLYDDLIYANKGVCIGDSGGPVTVDKITLVGVIKGSYHGSPSDNVRPECGSKNFPDMHTEVSKYRDWIDSTIASNP